MLKKMSIGTKLVLSFLMVSAITLIVGIVSYVGGNWLIESHSEVSVVRLPSVYGLGHLRNGSSVIRSAERTMLIDLSREEHDLQTVILKKAWEEAEKGWQIYEPLPQTKEEKALWRKFVPAWGEWKKEHQHVVDLADRAFHSENRADAEKLMNEAHALSFGEARRKFYIVNELLIKLTDLNEKIGERETVIGRTLAANLKAASLAAPIIGVLLSIVLGVIISRRVAKKLNQIVDAAHEIAKGNLAVKIEKGSADEIGQLADSFNQMIKGLQEYRDKLLAYSKELEASKNRLNEAQRIARVGSWDWDSVKNELTWSEEVYRIFGVLFRHDGLTHEAFLKYVHPEDRELVDNSFREAHTELKPYDIDYRIIVAGGVEKFVHEQARVHVDKSTGVVRMTGTVQDITERKKSEIALAEKAQELYRSNEDLERFAYVASHDLQEPLRTISSFTQLFARRYKNKLDSDADEFIAFIVEGAARMQRLINDLLAYSRVGTRGKEFVLTDCEKVLGHVLADLRETVDAGNAKVTHDQLPTLKADPTQMEQLFQNLISNAIKFRGNESPVIHISARKERKEWLFSVQDNGIGITPDYFDRIFIMFQRLHNNNEYPGTGIGLAICKKIVERHGGRIWVESENGKGTTFHFTISTANGK